MFALTAFIVATSCARLAPSALPPLSAMSRDAFEVVRQLIDTNQLRAARSRWTALNGHRSADGALAYGSADAAFSAGRFQAAFRLSDCEIFGAATSELNPRADDSGAALLLDRALQRASAGDVDGAASMLERAIRRDPSSLESRYFLGLVECARRDSRSARAKWKAAIDSDGYAQPPDGWTLPRAQQAAIERYLSGQC